MKKQVVFFISLTSFVCFSCKKYLDNDNRDNYITNPTSYVLKRQIWSGPTTNGQSFLYIYNDEHLISKIERYEWGTSSSNGGPLQTWYDTAHYTFEYTNGLCTKWTTEETGSNTYFVYEYNNRNLPVKRTLYYSDNSIQSYYSYKYDNRDNLIEMTDSSDRVDFRYVFTYNDSNNLTSAISYKLWSTPQQKDKSEWLSFDNKVNFIKTVNGLPLTSGDNNFHSYSSSSPNNFLSENEYAQINIDESFGTPDVYHYFFEYNADGLPVKMTYGPWTVTFEYEKYK